eukprot:CAMPEP_0117425140 /NCGR_PEP_ID=MMETSP0758-20121206/5448_1 /TAXON_ID=63605 /ORGANISM="Percolomonas cosmopolitus, Strain AE-1 (ATCC 50343)" /LENGTH=472 /DNA_ID=CAMNT_0005209399 /DNA_START=515 /DNA_END=1933 /DNA_ORIENTATION=+
MAGLNVIRIINEPTAAAIAYGIKQNEEEKKEATFILVYDLGGGTFDVSLLQLYQGVYEVQATAGNTHLGGEDFDELIQKEVFSAFCNEYQLPKETQLEGEAKQRLKKACEEAKRRLSQKTYATIKVNNLYKQLDASYTLTRARFEKLAKPLFMKALKPVREILKEAELEKDDIDDIILVGGSTRIPKIRELLSSYFKGKKLCTRIHPDEAVAHGAALQAAAIMGMKHDMLLIDVVPMSLGIETAGGMMTTLIEKNTTIPCRAQHIFTTDKDNQDTVTIEVFEGERAQTKDNHRLSYFHFSGIQKAPRGVPKIQVTFQVDVNGILHVRVHDLNSDASHVLHIRRSAQQGITLNRKEQQQDEHLIEKNTLWQYTDQCAMMLERLSTQNHVKLTSKHDDALALIHQTREWLAIEHTPAELRSKRKQLERFLNPLLDQAIQALSIEQLRWIPDPDNSADFEPQTDEDEDEMMVDDE